MKRSVIRRMVPVAILFSLAAFSGGCSTVSGFADLVGGVARDVKDAAEGSRDKSSQKGTWRGVYN